jgi:TolB-like protein/Tfp pilus assembly protein PilF
MNLFDELRRRKVFRVGLAYLALAWLLLQVAETLLPAYGFGDAVIRGLVAALAVGLVLTLVLAWIFEWTPEGVKVTAPAGEETGTGGAAAQRAPNAVIAAVIILAAVLAAWLTFRTVDVGPRSERSIAVLPFATLGQAQADVFTDGMHVGVISRLSNVADLDVISRTSVLAYRDSDRALPAIAADLGASWVLNADVQQVGDDVLVSVRLADARIDRQVWANEYQRSLTAGNVFEIQAEIAGRILEAVNARLTDREKERVAAVPTQNLDAYRLYQQGRALLDQRTPDAMRGALAYFERALEADPDYALVWAGLADALSIPVAYELPHEPDALERAERAVQRSLALDPELAEGWAAQAMLRYLRRDAPGAIADLQRAIDCRPSYAHAHSLTAFLQALIGNSEQSWSSAVRAVQLDPLSAEALSNLAATSVAIGRFEEGLDAARRGLERAPGWPNTRLTMGMVLYGVGDHAAAVEQLSGVSLPWTGAGAETFLFLSLLELGREEEAQSVRSLIEDSGDPYAMATVHAAMGEHDLGYEMLSAIGAWDDFPTQVFLSFHAPVWRVAENDPRFDATARRILASWGVDER